MKRLINLRRLARSPRRRRQATVSLRPPPVPHAPDVRRILNLPVSLTVQLAERDMPVESILKMTVGTIIEFDVSFDSQLILQVADRIIGYGQAVKVGESFGLRLSHIGSVVERIDALGGT